MKRQNPWIVETGVAQQPSLVLACPRCKRALGQEHEPRCPVRRRTVVARFSIDLVIPVPEHHDPVEIEMSLTPEKWCATVLVRLLQDLGDRLSLRGDCPCPFTTATFLREATEEDEDAQDLSVSDLWRERGGHTPDTPGHTTGHTPDTGGGDA